MGEWKLHYRRMAVWETDSMKEWQNGRMAV